MTRDTPALNLPPELTAVNQWVIWRYEQRESDAKPTKVPHTCQGFRASVTNPNHWSCFDYALRTWRERPGFADGIGFVFSIGDEYCGLDIDGCFPSDASEIASWAASIEQRFSDSYREQSPSQQGFKVFCKAKPPRSGKWPVGMGHIEVYDRGRFFTITGHADDSIPRVITDHQRDVALLVAYLDRLRGERTSPHRIEASISVGERHPALLSIAGTMWRRGMCAESIKAALLEVNARQCNPPRSPEHIEQIVRSMERWSR